MNLASLQCASASLVRLIDYSCKTIRSLALLAPCTTKLDAIRRHLFSLGISLAALDFHHDALDALKNLPPQQNKLLLTERI